MELIADLHLHSKYSRAVSPQMVIPEMTKWAKIKGIDLIGTGDFTHPQWLLELKGSLEECGQGIFRVSQKSKVPPCRRAGKSQSYNSKVKSNDVNFLLTTEISSIYSQGGKTRRIHNLVVVPSFLVVEKINGELRKKGCNLSSDGRPIVGLSAKNILELVLEVDADCLVIPCHIWTPHFSLFGSESGFDELTECFGDLSKYIYAVETGLSSDPEMNWWIPDLDNRRIVSFSDAHSPANLGREATVFISSENGISNFKFQISNFSYQDIRDAMVGKPGKMKIAYTVEFYPEEGKYHYTGHRNCGVVQSPEETEKKGTTCPVCGKRLTVGVMERVKKLSKDAASITSTIKVDEFGVKWLGREKRSPFVRLVPLAEIIAESLGVGDNSSSVLREYQSLTEKFGSEIEILMKSSLEEVAKTGRGKLAEGILKVRSGDIFIKPGFDGEYGKVRVWGNKGDTGEEGKKEEIKEQMSLFG